jgi:serine/threonine-protein kinase
MANDPHIDQLFDRRYLIQKKIGAGGMADVYLAEDQDLGRKVALKLLNDRHANDEQFVERFRREAQNAAGLSHPNIVSIFERGQAEGTYYIAMEYLSGYTLKELITRNGPPPIPVAIDYARQILSALGFAHRHGIVHRDIKPHNIVVSEKGHLKVTDFGIARSGASQMTEAGSIVGTAQYLSPEQARGGAVDPRSDLYSLGIVLYELLTGDVPFTGEAPVEIAMKHLTAIPEPPSVRRPGVPHELDAVVMRALAKDPEQRYDSADEMDEDLARIARGGGVSQRTEDAMTQVMTAVEPGAETMIVRPGGPVLPAPPSYRAPAGLYNYAEPAKRRRRRALWPWILGLVGALLIAAAVYLIYNRIQDQLNANKPIAVMDVGLMQKDLAKFKLEGQGLLVKITVEPSDTVPAGEVVEQDPTPNDRVARGSTVTIFVSSGKPKVSVPAVKGFTLDQAVSALTNAGLVAEPHEINSTGSPGTVIAQDPPSGQQVVKGSKVRINVSQGPKTALVPDVVGSDFATAAAALKNDGFVVIRQDGSSDQPAESVYAQDPPAGSKAATGSGVTLSVSSGPAVANVPDVTGLSQTDGVNQLRSAGFQPAVVFQSVTTPGQNGLILAESPPGGTAKQGSIVTITVGTLTTTTPATTPTTTAAVTTTSATTTTAGA